MTSFRSRFQANMAADLRERTDQRGNRGAPWEAAATPRASFVSPQRIRFLLRSPFASLGSEGRAEWFPPPGPIVPRTLCGNRGTLWVWSLLAQGVF